MLALTTLALALTLALAWEGHDKIGHDFDVVCTVRACDKKIL